MDAVSLKGLERVISVTIGGDASADSADAQTDVERAVAGKGKEVESLISGGRQKGSGGDYEEEKGLPLVHFRTYTLSFLRSGLPTPLVALSPHGPHLTFEMRRTQQPSAEMWKAALKKTVKKVASGNKKNKNVDGASLLSFCTFSTDPDTRDSQWTRWETRSVACTSTRRTFRPSKAESSRDSSGDLPPTSRRHRRARGWTSEKWWPRSAGEEERDERGPRWPRSSLVAVDAAVYHRFSVLETILLVGLKSSKIEVAERALDASLTLASKKPRRADSLPLHFPTVAEDLLRPPPAPTVATRRDVCPDSLVSPPIHARRAPAFLLPSNPPSLPVRSSAPKLKPRTKRSSSPSSAVRRFSPL